MIPGYLWMFPRCVFGLSTTPGGRFVPPELSGKFPGTSRDMSGKFPANFREFCFCFVFCFVFVGFGGPGGGFGAPGGGFSIGKSSATRYCYRY